MANHGRICCGSNSNNVSSQKTMFEERNWEGNIYAHTHVPYEFYVSFDMKILQSYETWCQVTFELNSIIPRELTWACTTRGHSSHKNCPTSGKIEHWGRCPRVLLNVRRKTNVEITIDKKEETCKFALCIELESTAFLSYNVRVRSVYMRMIPASHKGL